MTTTKAINSTVEPGWGLGKEGGDDFGSLLCKMSLLSTNKPFDISAYSKLYAKIFFYLNARI
jgi:hypothetical protein